MADEEGLIKYTTEHEVTVERFFWNYFESPFAINIMLIQ